MLINFMGRLFLPPVGRSINLLCVMHKSFALSIIANNIVLFSILINPRMINPTSNNNTTKLWGNWISHEKDSFCRKYYKYITCFKGCCNFLSM